MRYSLLAVPLVLLFPGAGLQAQSVGGEVVDASDGAPVRGALVSLRTGSGALAAEVLSDSLGRYLLRAPAAGSYTLRADRIGHRSTTSPPIRLEAGEHVPHRFAVAAERIEMEALVVTADGRRCEAPADGGTALLTLWEEARKSLRSARTGVQPRPLTYRVRRRVRQLDAATGRVLDEQADSVRERYSATPFVSVAHERGFVERRGDTTVYHAPDARVLLSDEFHEGHCFRVSRGSGDQAGMIGLSFQPVRTGDTPDIRGVLWMDARTGELRYLDYSYVGLPAGASSDRLGGRVEFRRLSSGGWIVPRWRIRMPQGGDAGQRSAGGARTPGVQVAAAGQAILEESGEVIQLRTPSGEVVALATYGSISGTVHDHTRGEVLPGARVSLVGTSHAAVADSAGRFTLTGIDEGAYSLAFTHPRLDSLGYTPDPLLVRIVPPEQIARDLAVPPLRTILASLCRTTGPDTAAYLAGRVAAADQRPLTGTQVLATWEQGRALTVADATGRFRFCALPAGVPLRVVARTRVDSAAVELQLASGEAGMRDFTLQPDAALAAAPDALSRLTGVLVDAQNGRPVAGAVVRLAGGSVADTTDRRGSFAFEALPVGSHSLTLEHPTYGTGVSRVELRGVPLNVQLRLPRRTVTLETITVQARRMDALDRMGHRSGRSVQVVTRTEVERRLGVARHVGDLVRRLNGVNVREINYRNSSMLKEVCIEPTVGRAARTQSGPALGNPTQDAYVAPGQPMLAQPGTSTCEGAAVFLDDVWIGDAGEFLRDFAIDNVESVEYVRPSEAAWRVGSTGGMGAILIYTRGNGPYVDVVR